MISTNKSMRLGERLISSFELWPNSFLVNINIIALHNCLSSSFMNDKAAANSLQFFSFFSFVKIRILGYWGVTTFTILSFVSIICAVYILKQLLWEEWSFNSFEMLENWLVLGIWHNSIWSSSKHRAELWAS